jgi:hypothetical protein
MEKFSTEEQLKAANRWSCIINDMPGSQFFDEEFNTAGLIYPGDAEYLMAYNHNVKDDDKKFNLRSIPYPWLGNPLKARVIILSKNPGYSEKEALFGKLIAKEIHPHLSEGYSCFIRDNLCLSAQAMLPEAEPDFGPSYRDLANIHGSWYWWNKLQKWVSDKLTIDDILQRVAVIQYVAYTSVRFDALPKGIVLPSQEYTKSLISFILENHPWTMFLVPRNVKVWKEFLGDIWCDYRFVCADSKYAIQQTLGPAGYDEEEYQTIMDALRL